MAFPGCGWLLRGVVKFFPGGFNIYTVGVHHAQLRTHDGPLEEFTASTVPYSMSPQANVLSSDYRLWHSDRAF